MSEETEQVIPSITYNKEQDRYELVLDKDFVISCPNNNLYLLSLNTTIQTKKILNLNPVPNFDFKETDTVELNKIALEFSKGKKEEFTQDLALLLNQHTENHDSCVIKKTD